MYHKAEDATWEAVFAEEDLEFVKYDRAFILKELRETKEFWFQASYEGDRLRMELEKLKKEAEKLESNLEEEKRRNRKLSLRKRNMK